MTKQVKRREVRVGVEHLKFFGATLIEGFRRKWTGQLALVAAMSGVSRTLNRGARSGTQGSYKDPDNHLIPRAPNELLIAGKNCAFTNRSDAIVIEIEMSYQITDSESLAPAGAGKMAARVHVTRITGSSAGVDAPC